MKILISTWSGDAGGTGRGDSKGIRYTYKGQEDISIDPTPLIMQAENIEHLIVISLDTIVDVSGHCGYQKYSELKEVAKPEIREFFDKLFSEFSSKKPKIHSFDSIISYGVGEFQNTIFSGDAMDCYYGILADLSLTFTNLLGERKKENETDQKNGDQSSNTDDSDQKETEIHVFLNITRGINFLVTLTYRALKEVIQILAYRYKVRFTVLNSDPLIQKAKPSELKINIIEDTKILPRLTAFRYQKQWILDPSKSVPDDLKSKIGRQLGQSAFLEKEINYFLSSFMHCLPVFAIYYLPDSGELECRISNLKEYFENHIAIQTPSQSNTESEQQRNKKIIQRQLSFNVNFENLVKAYLVSWLLHSSRFAKAQHINLTQIDNLKKKFWSKNFPVESNRIDTEIKDLKSIKSKLNQTYQPYGTMLNITSNRVDRRNFFAHAGFEYNSIEVRSAGVDIEVKPFVQKIEDVKQILWNSLPNF